MRRQGSQFTATDFIKVLAGREIKISMDGKGAWRDNVFVERLWRTNKYEEVYLQAYTNVPEARASIGRYPGFYNGRRPPSNRRENDPPDRSLIRLIPDGKIPDPVSCTTLTPEAAAA